MRIATADSSCSILDNNLAPTGILATAALIVDLPYISPIHVETRPGNYTITDTNVLVHELELCSQLVDAQGADCVHLDLTLGGINVLDITDEQLFDLSLSPMGRSVLHAILPDLRRLASQLDATHHIPVLAMGKRSIPVRLAELHAAVVGVQMAAEMALESEKAIHLGLPIKTSASLDESNTLRITSQEPLEDALYAEALIETPVYIDPYLNPVTRGFQVLRISAAEATDDYPNRRADSWGNQMIREFAHSEMS